MSEWLTKGFKEESPLRGLNRAELHAMAELSGEEGQLNEHEASVMKSLLTLNELTVKDAITHRTQVFSVPETLTITEFFHKHGSIKYSRIPIYEEGDSEQITGFVMRADLLVAQAKGHGDNPLSQYRMSMVTVLSSMPLSSTFDQFIKNHVHIVLVVDEYGGLEGILTLEDLLERLLGVDIEDEKDTNVSMRRLAYVMHRRKQLMMLKNVPDSSMTSAPGKK